LESLVVGEPQILGQVKEAFGRAKETGHVGPVLDRCLTLAFKSAKRVRSETEIARGGASVPSVAVDLAISIFGDLSDSTVLVVGAGEMAEQAAVHLRAAGVPEIAVVNRSEERGRTLAERVQGHYEPWERLAAELTRADVVVTSTGSRMPIIDRRQLKPVLKARRQRPLFFVDIAVPRDVEPAVARMDHVFLYNVDDLQGIVHDNLRSRHGEAQRASALVDEEVQTFLAWMRSRAIGPLIGKLQAHGRSIVDAEVERALAKLPDLPERDREVVQKLGRAIMQKLLHQPMTNVRRAAADPIEGFDGPVLAEALVALFALNASTEQTETRVAAEEPARAPEAKVVARPEPS
jgi:glutamyl-tRNA reductase